jgi:hypothetical protein
MGDSLLVSIHEPGPFVGLKQWISDAGQKIGFSSITAFPLTYAKAEKLNNKQGKRIKIYASFFTAISSLGAINSFDNSSYYHWNQIHK